MKQHLNTLFITAEGSYLSKEGETVVVKVERVVKLRVPALNLGGIVCFGRVGISPQLMGFCAEREIAISFMTDWGRLMARVTGFTSGNVLLRRAQYRLADDEPKSAVIARNMVAAKIVNSRAVLRRAVRDYPGSPNVREIERVAERLRQSAQAAACETCLDRLRGIEGEAASDYFSVFDALIRSDNDFVFDGRSRRPPRDKVNCLLSFLYSILMHDARSACEAAGLDAQVGFLHRDRPGRPSLALDLMEELRAWLADRLVLSMINRGQVGFGGFIVADDGGVTMTDDTRRTVLTAYQKRKQQVATHPYLNEKTTAGLVVHLQARLLARFLRGDLDAYPAFIWK